MKYAVTQQQIATLTSPVHETPIPSRKAPSPRKFNWYTLLPWRNYHSKLLPLPQPPATASKCA